MLASIYISLMRGLYIIIYKCMVVCKLNIISDVHQLIVNIFVYTNLTEKRINLKLI